MEQLKNILFIDIETVPCVPEFSLLKDSLQAEWVKKAKYVKSPVEKPLDPAELFVERGGIFSEFSKVVCIVVGSLVQQEGAWKLRLKSLVHDDETQLLNNFCDVLARFRRNFPDLRFCGHNIKEFDIPFLCRRMIINGVPLPDCMQLSGKKPWEINHLDTLELWRFGDYKHFTSLALLAAVLDIPSPKNDLDGSMVGSVYWKDKDLERIGRYCIQDVLTTAKVFLKLKGETIAPEPIIVTD
ncbi:MAG: ribonuclease H-like domain-containing protein [Flavipsychrobacter sp.]|nr:ribonuclease H-like domain-containing protein [Flavipsychrobacter sp.]